MKERAIELGCPPEKIISLPIGIDLSKFSFKERKPSDKINFLYIGRMVEKKGVIYAIRAFAKAYQKHKNISFTLVGDGPLRAQLEAEVDRLGMRGPIKMLGAVPDIKPELDKAHVFVSPSVVAKSGDAEGGINVTVIEALASGLPALVTRQTQSELVFDDKSGYIAKENDADDLSEKMEILIKNPQKITEFGIIGRRFAEELDSKKQVARLEDLYRELIGNNEKRNS
jgi:colanic acid/amylovoran biosynthesis glycosyltransferase